MTEFAIKIQNVGKSYNVLRGGEIQYGKTLREDLVSWVKRPFQKHLRSKNEQKWVLRDLSLNIKPGEIVGIIGRNGAGKSTLLKLIARVVEPTVGRIDLHGQVGALLEVGTGFHGELTGRENIFLSGTILGMRRKEIEKRFDEIVDYAGVESFLDMPLKRYSSGMFLRLAFSVMAHLRADILIVDEVLAVGDMAFQEKCLGTMAGIAEKGRTILFVSHQMESIAALCTKVALIDQGSLVTVGEPREVIDRYYGMLKEGKSGSLRDRTDRKGKGGFRFVDAWVENARGQITDILHSGEAHRFVLTYEVSPEADLRNIVVGISILSPLNQHIAELNAGDLNKSFDFRAGSSGRLVCDLKKLALNSGLFHLDITAKHKGIGGEIEDCIHHAGIIAIEPGRFYEEGGIVPKDVFVLMEHDWEEEVFADAVT